MLLISFGHFAADVVCSTRMQDLLARAYGVFAGRSGDLDETWKIVVRESGVLPEQIQRELEVDKNPVDVGRDESCVYLQGSWFHAQADLASRVAELESPVAAHPLDSLVRILYVITGVQKHGILLHGGGIQIGEEGCVIFGPSGAGKSTLCQAARDRALSDELVAVRRSETGWVVMGTPFWQGRDVCLPLKRALALEQSSEKTSIENIAAREAFRRLWRETQVTGLLEGELAAMMGLVDELAAAVSVLRVKLSDRTWPDVVEAVRMLD